ncbi:hypothetical protein ACIP10_35980 [Streptomyces galbus]|uniref:hypothetical protein n=1 Tax=Streptomyces galbus TaxID=33898 RepID=UPI00380791D3
MTDLGQYRGDVTALRSGATRLEGIRADWLALARDFQNDVSQYNNWYGTSDEFATTVGPRYDENLASLLAALNTMVDIVEGLARAKLEEMQAVQKPQNYALDEINLAGMDSAGDTETGRR